MSKKLTESTTLKLAVMGASLAGIAATAYFFFGPKGKEHRQYAKAWAIKMRGDVIEKLELAHEITEPIYLAIIDTVAKEYKRDNKASQIEIDELSADLKKHWKSISELAIDAKKKLSENTSQVTKEVKKVLK
ncbi:MAG: hypothetical protein IPN70_00885 [Candidatus Moraniibacteriota bacterium]|nr:MAG: hypothetical protein IPN70_00885 [Candidatus Moranbacteria bacterium]